MRKAIASFTLVLMCSSASYAQVGPDKWTPAFPNESARKTAEVLSWATVGANIGIDVSNAWKAPDRAHALQLTAARAFVTWGTASLVKGLIHRQRPCAPACGVDSADSSFYSMHTAFAFQAIGGRRVQFTLPLAISTGGMRIAAGKHWLTDTLVGAGIGALTSRIR